jgi:acetyltransferase-like isoleucine patch superfamily enzyme
MSYISKIRNREGVIPDLLYRTYKEIQHFNIYPVPVLYHFLAFERATRRALWFWLKRKFYDEPIFKLKCRSCGRGFNLLVGIPLVYGDLDLHIGEHVTMHGSSTFSATKVLKNPRLTIGNRTHCGSYFGVSVGADVFIGDDVLIASLVTIYSYDSHPLDYKKRQQGLPAEPESSLPVHIGNNVWICSGAIILKGVTIGENSVVAAGAVVAKDVPPNVIVAGNPARIVKRLSFGENREAALLQEAG